MRDRGKKVLIRGIKRMGGVGKKIVFENVFYLTTKLY